MELKEVVKTIRLLEKTIVEKQSILKRLEVIDSEIDALKERVRPYYDNTDKDFENRPVDVVFKRMKKGTTKGEPYRIHHKTMAKVLSKPMSKADLLKELQEKHGQPTLTAEILEKDLSRYVGKGSVRKEGTSSKVVYVWGGKVGPTGPVG